MTHVDIGVTGAKRTSVEEYNPLALLQMLIEKYPNDSETRLLSRFTEEVKDDSKMLEVVIGYTFANLMKRLREKRSALVTETSVAQQVRRSAAVDRVRADVDRAVKKKVEQLLMDMRMPNGKRLGDCTIHYVGKLGGWLGRIAEGKNPRQTVSHVYDEEQLRALQKV